MRVAAIQSNYLPWKGYFDIINDVDVFVFYDEVKYTKNDWRNRNRIYPASGVQWLSIPISKDAVKLKISEVDLLRDGTDHDWQNQHHRMLEFAYRRAPHFPQLKEFIDDLYLKHQWRSLSELNRYAITRVCEKLGIKTQLRQMNEFKLANGKIERLLDLLVQLGATEYISGPTGKDYLELHRGTFESKGIVLTYKDYSDYAPYRQVGGEFQSAVSIVDMIAHLSWNEIPRHIWPRFIQENQAIKVPNAS